MNPKESRNVPGLGRLRFERSEEGWLGFMAPLYVVLVTDDEVYVRADKKKPSDGVQPVGLQFCVSGSSDELSCEHGYREKVGLQFCVSGSSDELYVKLVGPIY